MAEFWFGNLRKAGYFPAPNTDMKANPQGEADVMQFADGGAFVGQSDGTHKEFQMDWGVQERAAMNFLSEYRNGVHGSGLLYFADPFAVNVLPPHWARPELTCNGWPSLVAAGNKPSKVGPPPVTNFATNPGLRTTSGTSTIRTNYAVDPTPTSTGPRITSGSTAATYTNVAGGGHGGANALKITTDATAGTRGVALSVATVPVTATITVSGYVKLPVGQVINIGLRVYPDASSVNTTANTSNYTGTGDWQRISASITNFASGTRVGFYIATSYASSDIFVSKILFEQSAYLGEWFDGSTAADANFTYQWNGTAGASTSIAVGQTPATASAAAGQTTVHRLYDTSAYGNYTSRFTFLSSGNTGINFALPDRGTLNAPMTILMRVRSNKTLVVRPRIHIVQTAANITLPANEWVWIRGDAVVGVTSHVFTGLLVTAGAGHQIGDTIDVDRILVTDGVYTGPYFDGTSEFVDGTAGVWVGTPEASYSTIARSSNGAMPTFGAEYTLTGAVDQVPKRKLTLLVPPDRDLVFGFSGTTTGGAVLRVRGVNTDGAYEDIQDLTLLDPAGQTRMNVRVQGSRYSAVQVFMVATAVGAPKISLFSGKAVYCLPTDTPVLTGGHSEGEGHGGFRFMDTPAMSYIQAADGHRYVTTAASFAEIEPWL